MLGISTDARATQTAWSVSLGNIPFPILSDFYPHGEMTISYGLYNDEKGTSFRAIIVVDKEGIIRFRRVYTSAADIHTDDILAEVDKVQASG